ncbi:hypothetical protein LLG10_06850 [bacterium]|nr:hypothetical protein [bacterium]
MIPKLNNNGFLPPFDLDHPTSHVRSPYKATLNDISLSFCASGKRQMIFDGFLKFRAKLHEIGLLTGFQWINSSFTQDTELIDNRDPNDIDVVTFFYLPPLTTQELLFSTYPEVFDMNLIKKQYHVHSFYLELNNDSDNLDFFVRSITYWYSLWSHNRYGKWKGFLEVDLSYEQNDVGSGII